MRAEFLLNRIRIAFAVAVAAMVIFGLAAHFTIDRLVSFARGAVQSESKLFELGRFDASLSRTQTALRDYVLSGKPADLERLYAHMSAQEEALAALGTAPALPQQQALERLLGQRVRLQYDVAAATFRGDPQAATALLTGPASSRLNEEIRTVVEAAHQQQQQTWAMSHALPVVGWAQQLTLAAVALLLAMLGWVFWLVTHLEKYDRQQQRVLAMLGDSEAVSRSLAANMADGLITTGADLQVTDINEAGLRLLGYQREEALGMHISELIAPTAQCFVERLAKLLGQPEPFKLSALEVTGRHRTGAGIALRLSMNDMYLDGKRVVTALLHDMSGVHQATVAVEASEQHLRQITNALPVQIGEFDAQLRLRFHNRALAEFVGHPDENLVGLSLSELIPPDQVKLHQPYLEQSLQGDLVSYEVKVASDGAGGDVQHWRVQMMPRHGPDGRVQGVYTFATNITPLKRIDAMKTEFISIVSHELRTPLTSIRGSLGLIAGGVAGSLPERALQLVGIAKNNCDRLVRLINDLLDVEKIESGKVPLRMEPAQIVPLVKQALLQMEPLAQQHQVRLQLQAPEGPLQVRVDSDRLLQVVTNLLSNAVKFSPEKATVTVRVDGQGGRVRLEVADQGPGVPPEFQPRLFHKFSQADSSDRRDQGGTGLGLNISRTLTEKMGGVIGFHSPPGAGATFYVELPRWSDSLTALPPGTSSTNPAVLPVPRPPPAAPRPVLGQDALARGAQLAPCKGKCTILHVEDDADIREIVAAMTADCAVCIPAGSVQEARLRLRQGRYDLLLLDLELGDGSGWELLADLRELGSRPPVIVFSAHCVEPPPDQPLEAMLVKALTSEAELLHAIRRTLPAGPSACPSVFAA